MSGVTDRLMRGLLAACWLGFRCEPTSHQLPSVGQHVVNRFTAGTSQIFVITVVREPCRNLGHIFGNSLTDIGCNNVDAKV